MPSAGFKLANKAAADLRLRSRSHRDRLSPTTMMMMIMMIMIIITTNISIIYNRAVLSPVSCKNIFCLLFKIIIKFSLIESGLAVRVWRSNCWREFIFDSEPGSSVSIVLATGWTTGRSSFDPRQWRKNFYSNLCVQTGSGAHPASCRMGTRVPSPWAKARPGRDADHSPPSSAEVENE
jgi:hypothetical protein